MCIFSLVLLFATAALAQVDDFSCPDEFEGYYPHLYRSVYLLVKIMLITHVVQPSCILAVTTKNCLVCTVSYNGQHGFLDTHTFELIFTSIQKALSSIVYTSKSKRPLIILSHLSCDKYWACQDGLAELRTCGNGLAFIEDEEYKVEQCEELHLVECGERTELEEPISTTNCPRLWGTFADPEDCGVFWKCQDGKANR